MPVTLTPAERPVTFASKRPQQRCVMVAGTDKYNTFGAYVGGEAGHTIEFNAGRFDAKYVEEIEWLRDRINHGLEIYELGQTNAPDSKALIEEIIGASPERIIDIRDEERSSWQRKDVLSACDRMLARLGMDETAGVPEGARAAYGTEGKVPEDAEIPKPVERQEQDIPLEDLAWPELQKVASSYGIKGGKRDEILERLKELV